MAPFSKLTGQRAGVEFAEAGDLVGDEVVFQGGLCGEVAADLGDLADDQAATVDLLALDVVTVGAVVADLGVGHGDHLSGVGGVREDLLVARHGRVENDLSYDGFTFSVTAPLAIEHTAVFQ